MNTATAVDPSAAPALVGADDLLTAQQAAALLGCSRRMVYKLLDEHAFDRVVRRGERFIRIPRSAVDRFIADHTEVIR